MNAMQAITTLVGGLGLFLLGMVMMSDGLKLAAGPALHRILAASTRTRWHALGSGMLVTALVQSSSAVTVAAIGFVNAGLLGLGPSLWVLFGANVGTTMTGWIVALIGLKFKVEALALPLIGLGVLLQLTAPGRRRGAIGSTVAGFGLLFFGIALLQQAFAGIAAQLNMPQGEGWLAVLAQLGAGVVMTVLMQSSSAAMAITLAAAQSGLLTAQSAAAVVIGANIGTTVTAVLASIAATPNARRAATGHVVFNLLAGAVALLLLPWMIGALTALGEALSFPADAATKLALFHTTFNVLGVLLMWPLAAPLARSLQQRFSAREQVEGEPRHLDSNVLAVPALALDALELESARIGQMARTLARAAVDGERTSQLTHRSTAVASLTNAAEAFVERINRAAMAPSTSQRLARVLRQLRYYEEITEQAHAAAMLRLPVSVSGHAVVVPWREHAKRLLLFCDRTLAGVSNAELDHALNAMESAYEDLKSTLLTAGAAGQLSLTDMEQALRHFSALRRAAQQALKAARLGSSAIDAYQSESV